LSLWIHSGAFFVFHRFERLSQDPEGDRKCLVILNDSEGSSSMSRAVIKSEEAASFLPMI
jgi:hypothetical protein